MNIKILGKSWKIKLLDKKKFNKRWGEDKHDDTTYGISITHKRKIFIKNFKFCNESIVHELVHAYLAEIGMESASMINKDAFEELVCDLFARHGEAILKQAKEITKKFKIK